MTSRLELLARWARDRGDRPALINLRTGRSLSFAGLWERSGHYASHIEDTSGRRAVAAVVLSDAEEFVPAAVGVLRARGILTTVPPDLPAREMLDRLEFIGPRVIVGAVPAGVAEQVNTAASLVTPDGTTRFAQHRADPSYDVAPSWVRFRHTSGTLAHPRLVVLSLDADEVHDRRRREEFALEPGTVAVSMFEVGHDTIILAAVSAGATYVTPADHHPRSILNAVVSQRASVVIAIPWVFQVWAGSPELLGPLRGLRLGVRMGPLPQQTLKALYADTGCVVVNQYGTAETGPVMHPPTSWSGARMDSIGRPFPDLDVRLAAPDGQDAPGDTPGELWVRGPGVMEGYLKDPVSTAEVLQDGWLRTGDLLRRDEDGYYYVVGRLKAMINVAGRKVSPEEIEAVLLRHRGVREAAVVGVPDPVRGQRVEALVVPAAGSTVSVKDLRAFCRTRLAPFKVPRAITIVEALPHTRYGRITRREAMPPRGRLGSQGAGGGTS